MKPGDMIEWVYVGNKDPVVEDEEFYSSVEKRWVPIGEKVLLISLTDGVMTYLSSKGLFRARVDDASTRVWSSPSRAVVQCVRS